MRAAVRISVSQRVHVKAWNFSEANLQIAIPFSLAFLVGTIVCI
jgi:hypothetical protein